MMSSFPEILILVLVALAVSANVFSAVFLNGFLKTLPSGRLFVIAMMVAIIIGVLGTIGLFLGYTIRFFTGSYTSWLSAIIILMLGLKLVIKSFKPKFNEMSWEMNKLAILIGFSIASGINFLLAGMSMIIYPLTPLTVFLVFTVVCILVTLAGIFGGKKSKNFLLAARVELAGGIMLTGIGTILLVNLFKMI